MLKVNEERILQDHAELVERRKANLVEVEEQARSFAISRGYDEERTAKFVAYTSELEGDGLSAEDKIKLELLESYIEDVEEPEEEPRAEEPHEEAVGTEPEYGLINNI